MGSCKPQVHSRHDQGVVQSTDLHKFHEPRSDFDHSLLAYGHKAGKWSCSPVDSIPGHTKLGLWYSCANFGCLGSDLGLKAYAEVDSLARTTHSYPKKLVVKLKIGEYAQMSSEAGLLDSAVPHYSLVD